MPHKPRFAEFFAGAGMVHAALEGGWTCALANDIDPVKTQTYRANWPSDTLIEGDIASLDPSCMEHPFDLVWASSPCQDFSLAGRGAGLTGARSGLFHKWLDLLKHGAAQGAHPTIIAFENVTGLVSRNSGKDFAFVLNSLTKLGYVTGALEIDARWFLPQSRPRLFVVAIRDDLDISHLCTNLPDGPFHTAKLQRFVQNLPKAQAKRFAWWRHDTPSQIRAPLSRLLDETPDTEWYSQTEVDRLISMMSQPSLDRLTQATRSGALEVGTLYKRGRPGADGLVRQRAEFRLDGIAGCLRTPAGGSSRQTLVLVKGNEVRARLLSTLELRRLMGLPDEFIMPERYNAAYKVAGDGVVVPIVEYLDAQLFQPVLRQAALQRNVA